MSKFLKDFEQFAKENNYHLFRTCEIKDGISEETVFIPSHPSLESYSVSKAFVVTAVGMMYDDGLLQPTDKLTELLGDDCPADALECYRELTVHHALKHKMGLPSGYLDIDCNHPSTYGKDFLKNMLTCPPVNVPGTEPIYTDAAFYILARVVEKLAGCSLEELMWDRLFTPLDFREAAWSKCPMGHAMGGTGLYISTSDMAKLGAVYLNGGMYGNNRIISEDWVNITLKNGYELHPICGGIGYGKGGMMGQMMMVIPAKKRIVAWHAYDKKNFYPLIEWVCNYTD